MSLAHTLTGRTRHRVQYRWWSSHYVLVLQMEVRVTGFEIDHCGGSRDIDYTYWRDAKVEDQTTEERLCA